MRVIKFATKILAIIAVFAILVVGGYVGYVAIQYYRIDDNYSLLCNNNQNQVVSVGQEYTISTFNIGFGAYTHDFSFFMDSGEFFDGTQVSGKWSTAKDKQTVLTNTNGVINEVKKLNADFMFFQEVDEDGDRSHHVNQLMALQTSFADFASVYAQNFHTAKLLYPFNDPHGKTNAGIVTLSNKKIAKAVRRSFPVDESFPNKFFDLDRCFSLSYIPVDGSDKYLCLINVHASAYDEGGVIRKQQMQMLNQVMTAEKDAGNYVVVGGDFNHDIADSHNAFATQMKKPGWVFEMSNNDLADGFRFATAKNAPTCRSTDVAYTKGVNYTVVVDGFILSDNVESISVQNIDLDFKYSDHNPVVLKFKLK